jgi:alpha-glucosidase (family GH31 glycosyl hydrolase)
MLLVSHVCTGGDAHAAETDLRAIARENPPRLELRSGAGTGVSTLYDAAFREHGGWRQADPGELEAATNPAGNLAVRIRPRESGAIDRVAFKFALAPDEHVYGFGQRFGVTDQRGQRFETFVTDRILLGDKSAAYVADPFFVSTRGYGMMARTTRPVAFDIGRTIANAISIEVPASSVDLELFGGDPARVIERRAAVIGRPPLPPPWSLGIWKTTIGGSASVSREVGRLRGAGIPVSAVWLYDAVDRASRLGWDERIYPTARSLPYRNLERLTTRLHAAGLRVMGYRNPDLEAGDRELADLQSGGQVFAAIGGAPGERWTLDFRQPRALNGWDRATRRILLDLGFNGWMQDFGDAMPRDARLAGGRSGIDAHNAYAVDYLAISYRGAQVLKSDVVLLTRSGYQGGQAFATNGFPGDQTADWSPDWGIASVIPAMLSAGISGWPYWGPDIGGYLDPREPVADPRELWFRWVELGALSPTMRDHLGDRDGRPIDLWTDQGTVDHFRRYARLHRCLEPYLLEQAATANRTGLPIMRHMAIVEPGNPNAWTIDDAYLIGPDLLAAPVVRPGVTRRPVWLPTGRWIDLWTDTAHDGPAWLSVNAPIDQVPIFLRYGTGIADMRSKLLRAVQPGRLAIHGRSGFGFNPCG